MSQLSPSKLCVECQVDRISELPEEILSSILSYGTVGDAVFASVLSRRWRHLWAALPMPNLAFDWDSMFCGRRENFGSPGWLLCREGSCPLHRDRFVRGVNQFMRNYKGAPLVSLRVAFCLGVEHKDDIGHWVSSALTMGIERLDLCLKCDNNAASYDWVEHNYDARYIFRYELLSQAEKPSKLHYLSLSKMVLGPGVPNPFGSLKSLQLAEVLLWDHHVVDIFSCFVNLETLLLISCRISHLRIPLSAKRLKFLALVRCIGVNMVSLSNSAVTTFEYFGYSKQETVQFRSSNVPHLRNIHIGSSSVLGWEYLLCEIARDHSFVESLSISSDVIFGVCWEHKRIAAFNNVKKLELSIPRVGFSAWMLSVILRACPMLEKLYLACRMESLGWRKINGAEAKANRVTCEHLKEIHIGGFSSGRGGQHEEWLYKELVGFCLRAGVRLERLIIDPQCNIYEGANQWNRRHGRLTWEEGERERLWSAFKTHPRSSLIVLL